MLGIGYTPYLERDGLVGLSRKEEVLPLPVRRLHLLLVGRHEPVPRLDPLRYLGVVHLKHEGLLAGLGAPLLGHPVAGTADLDKLLDVNAGLLGAKSPKMVHINFFFWRWPGVPDQGNFKSSSSFSACMPRPAET